MVSGSGCRKKKGGSSWTKMDDGREEDANGGRSRRPQQLKLQQHQQHPSFDNHGLDDSQTMHGATSNNCCGENGKTEIYDEHQSMPSKPWWKMSFLEAKPILFGTWDGVFTSCMINMFGVVVFLRTGWMVGNAGITYSLVIILMTEIVALISILSSIGVCERCHLDSGGIYCLLSRVLGNRVGATIGLIYCFGQAVMCSLCVLAFGESIMDLLNMHDDVWVTRAIAAGLLVILVGVNVAGVLWVVGLQLIFVFLLFVAVLDFLVGSFIGTDPAQGIVGYRWQTLVDNSGPNYNDGETFFTVLGVFFPSVCGVFAGFNMSGDLRDPKTNISVGTLSAIVVCTAIYVLFAMVLGSTCIRQSLKTDYMIGDRISATRVFWNIGLYELSISAAAGSISGPPYILQAIAADNPSGIFAPIAEGRGPNKVPVFATLVFAVISLAFIFVGQLNTLGPVLTIPFLLTYASVDYANFILITTFDMKDNKKKTKKEEEEEVEKEDKVKGKEANETSTLQKLNKGYGTINKSMSSQSLQSDQSDSDLDNLFPSERLPPNSSSSVGATSPSSPSSSRGESPDVKPSGECLKRSPSVEQRNINDNDNDNDAASAAAAALAAAMNVGGDACKTCVSDSSSSLPAFLHNRWLSLFGALISVAAMFGIQWQYAVANVAVALLLWFVIGMSNACLFPGIGEFSLLTWIYSGIRNTCYRLRHKRGRRPSSSARIVLKPNAAAMFPTTSGQISDENEDFADRVRYHQTEVVGLKPFPVYDDSS